MNVRRFKVERVALKLRYVFCKTNAFVRNAKFSRHCCTKYCRCIRQLNEKGRQWSTWFYYFNKSSKTFPLTSRHLLATYFKKFDISRSVKSWNGRSTVVFISLSIVISIDLLFYMPLPCQNPNDVSSGDIRGHWHEPLFLIHFSQKIVVHNCHTTMGISTILLVPWTSGCIYSHAI